MNKAKKTKGTRKRPPRRVLASRPLQKRREILCVIVGG